jgi:hypothetical protein
MTAWKVPARRPTSQGSAFLLCHGSLRARRRCYCLRQFRTKDAVEVRGHDRLRTHTKLKTLPRLGRPAKRHQQFQSAGCVGRQTFCLAARLLRFVRNWTPPRSIDFAACGFCRKAWPFVRIERDEAGRIATRPQIIKVLHSCCSVATQILLSDRSHGCRLSCNASYALTHRVHPWRSCPVRINQVARLAMQSEPL